jgi:Bacterial SH3 domain
MLLILKKTILVIALGMLAISGVQMTVATPGNERLVKSNLIAQSCTSRFMTVSTPDKGPLNVRDRPNINAKVISTIPNGSVVYRKGWDASGDWADIVTSRGRGFEGWVWSNYLTCGAD